jgi:hypothetical protein
MEGWSTTRRRHSPRGPSGTTGSSSPCKQVSKCVKKTSRIKYRKSGGWLCKKDAKRSELALTSCLKHGVNDSRSEITSATKVLLFCTESVPRVPTNKN